MYSGSRSSRNLNDLAYSASPKSTARRNQARTDDGFHTQPAPSSERRWPRRIAIALAVAVCVVAVIFILRATFPA